MQRRSNQHALTAIPRRSGRFYVVIALVIVGTFFFARQTHDAIQEMREPLESFEPRQNGGDELDETSCTVSAGETKLHAIDEYVKGFPRLRGKGELGRPVAQPEEGKVHFDWPRTTKMIVFGDSYSTLDTDYRKNGVDGGHHEKLHHKATDMKWSDYLYAVFQDFHVLQYYNFARPGAVIDPVIVPPGLEKYGTFQTQVQEFEDLFTPMPGPSRANWHSNDTLFVVFFGINDMGRMNREDLGRQDITTTTRRLAQSLVSSCRKLQSLGARNFLILNVPPLEHSPKYSLAGETGILSHELIGESVKTFNRFLKEETDAWIAENDGLAGFRGDDMGNTEQISIAGSREPPSGEGKNVMLFDLERYWRLVLDYPEAFGMTECARYQMWIDEKRPNLGRMGYCYHDNQHISWSAAELTARNVHGFLLRHSTSFQYSNATETALHA